MSPSALVTGASRGIGLAIATRLAQSGYGLTISARSTDTLELAAKSLREAGAPNVVVVPADMADPAAAETLVARHAEAFGDMRALILNAGIGTAGALLDFPQRRLDKTVAVNFSAPFALIQRALPLLRAAAAQEPRRGAKVVAISSITGVYAEPTMAAYGATKAALTSLIETMNMEESGNGVSGCSVAPAFVDTDMTDWIKDRIPAEEMIAVEDIVEIVDALLRLSAQAVVPKIVVSRAGANPYGA
ncbi:SDR family oxidoreductase [Aldersonia sp. NBC_00410]|uniref:SDR family NAD(P)-dependent oxidoreductase n=1 Tax=Aldersonia sp. NBC_00410 TaxID=2975954 RepID=UPI00224EA878|nr:SDR family oxidoreductase [Aldersonia sp. NBC_00410]MCX5044789.1 SDR family oxidoreductase [Aldersonia sp. NBC_00410]